jgi:hypothetical protein
MEIKFKDRKPVQLEQYIGETLSQNVPWILSHKSIGQQCIPIVTSRLSIRDRWGFIRMRLGIGRTRYTIHPGLYGIGDPDPQSPVFVTANYKMSFDILRRDLTSINGLILVLDTRGINVWCAAGKGTFGTEELIRRINLTRLSQVVSHRNLILPQLGAVGVAAHEVKKQIGFKVCYGPVYSRNIRVFLENGCKVDPEMRRIRFSLSDRLAVTPLELFPALKYYPLFILFFLLKTELLNEPLILFLRDSLGLLGAVITGSVLVPILLPLIPGAAFSFKGAFLGFFFSLVWSQITVQSLMNTLTNLLIYTSAASYLALNFTGTSTFTNMSGVYKEMRISLPLMIPSLVVGMILYWF